LPLYLKAKLKYNKEALCALASRKLFDIIQFTAIHSGATVSVQAPFSCSYKRRRRDGSQSLILTNSQYQWW